MKDGIYFDEKKSRKRQVIFKLKIYGGLFAFLLLIIGFSYLAVYSPIFQLKNIELVGNRDFKADELVQELKTFFINQSKLASILGPNNILIWKKDVSQFKKSNPKIADLIITKDYPNRKIKIEIKEREKFGIWCITTNSCSWFDRNGIIFAEAPFVEGALINKVSDFTNRQLVIGDKVFEQRFLGNLLKIFKVLEESDLGTGFLKLENLDFQEIIFSHPLGFKIYFSLRIDPGFTLAGIRSVKETRLDKIDYIDFRVENRVYYKPN